MMSVLCIAFKSALWLGVRNRMITHRKLPLLHCYHIFSTTRGLYLAKNHYENYSPPQMVPMAQILGPPGSRTTRNFKKLDVEDFLLIYTTYIRPRLEFCIQSWSPHLTKTLERVQRTATRLIPQFSKLSYEE